MSVENCFSHGAADYATFRPRYPAALFDFLASSAPRRETAWDCATGNGQAALGLAWHFARVVATDASPEQIAHAVAHPRVAYRVAAAEASGLATGSVDLVTVAQALHWLDRTAFYREARRVLAVGGVVAAWCYGLPEVSSTVDRVLRGFYADTVGPYWRPERRLVESGYRTVAFPFAEFAAPPFAIEQRLTLDELAGYVRTWSATRRYVQAQGRDPVHDLIAQLRKPWGRPGARRTVCWPLSMRAGRATEPARV